MDGSTLAMLAQNISVTSTGLLVLGTVAVILLARSLKKHLDECSDHIRKFHEADRKIENRLSSIETDVAWIKRNLGFKDEA